MFISYEKQFENENEIRILLDYNSDFKGEAIYDKRTDSFSYTNKIDEKFSTWRPVFFIEKKMRQMINENKPGGIYAIG